MDLVAVAPALFLATSVTSYTPSSVIISELVPCLESKFHDPFPFSSYVNAFWRFASKSPASLSTFTVAVTVSILSFVAFTVVPQGVSCFR